MPVKLIDTQRRLAHLIFLCGYSREELYKLVSIGRSTYDKKMLELKNAMGKENIKKISLVSGEKKLGLDYNRYKMTTQYFLDVHKLHPITEQEVQCYIKILSFMNCKDKCYTGSDFLEVLDQICMDKYCVEQKFIKLETINGYLEELYKVGFLSKKGKYYTINLSFEEYMEYLNRNKGIQCLYDVMTLCSALYPLSSLPLFICQRIDEWTKFHVNIPLEKDSPFVFQNYYWNQLLDDEIYMTLIRAIKQRKIVEMELFIPEKNEREIDRVIPVKMIEDRYGRQYLLAFSESNQRAKIYYLDEIATALVGDTEYEINEQSSYYKTKQLIEKCFSLTSLNDIGNPFEEDMIQIEIMFQIFELEEKFIFKKLGRKKGNGKVEEIDKYRRRYVIRVLKGTERELIPWIRSFAEYAVVQPSTQHILDKMISGKWERAKENYEILS